MKNQKVIEIIDDFPPILYRLKQMMKNQENTDFILDASDYSKPIDLLKVTTPDIVLLNLRPAKGCLDYLGKAMQDNADLEVGMITNNPKAYYMSLCSTLCEQYTIDKGIDLEFIPEGVARLQFN